MNITAFLFIVQGMLFIALSYKLGKENTLINLELILQVYCLISEKPGIDINLLQIVVKT